MKVRLRLFAALREAVGSPELQLDLPEGATAETAWTSLVGLAPRLEGRRRGLAASVNRRYAAFETALREGDEIVFIPPVSGG
jgi:molybdopterin converting factor subunit 1